MRLRSFVINMLLLAIMAPAAVAAETRIIDLRPDGKWVLDGDDNSCILARSFVSEEQRITVSFTRVAPGDAFALRAFGSPFGSSPPVGSLSVAFAETPSPNRLNYLLSGKAGETPFVDLGRMTFLDADPDENGDVQNGSPQITPAQEAAIRWLTIGSVRGTASGWQLVRWQYRCG